MHVKDIDKIMGCEKDHKDAVNYMKDAVNYMKDAVNYMKDAVNYMKDDRNRWPTQTVNHL